MLQKVGLKDSLFIAMSNYYYEEKNKYLRTLANVRDQDHDLTQFILFGLKGIELQCNRLFREIQINISKALFRNVMYDLFMRLQSTRKRVIAERQVGILKVLLTDKCSYTKLREKIIYLYKDLKNPSKAFTRDMGQLLDLGAIDYMKTGDNDFTFFARLEWATEITESDFFKKINKLPKAKTQKFL